MVASVTSIDAAEARPTQRGVLCVYGFVGFLAIGALLFALDPRAWRWPVLAFALSVVALMGTSALYHRVTWSPEWYVRIRRLDHAMIFVLITGTELPLFRIALAGSEVDGYFALALGAAGLGFLVTMLWAGAPKWVRTLVYVLVGWSPVPVMGYLADAIGGLGLGLLATGGALYSIGAVAYGLRWPNPFPGRFGYHEVFHAFVIAAVATHYAVVVFWVL